MISILTRYFTRGRAEARLAKRLAENATLDRGFEPELDCFLQAGLRFGHVVAL
jgi:hypothetical protein